MAGDRPKNLLAKFSALNVNFSSSSLDPLGSKRPAQAGVKDCYPLPLPKNGYFAANGLCVVKTVANRHRHAAYSDNTSNSDGLFKIHQQSISMTLNDPEPQREGVLVIFSHVFGCSAHFKNELRRNI